MIKDQDKQMEYAFRVQEMAQTLALKLMETKTYPWIDGLVKLAYASEAIVKGLFRPAASAALFLFGLMNPDVLTQLHELGGMGDTAIAGIFGSFPGWIYSRHQEKKRKTEPDEW